MRRLLTVVLLLTVLVSMASAKIWYVKQGGSGIGDGTSWANAAPEISMLLAYYDDTAHSYPIYPHCDSVKKIEIIQSSYPPILNPNCPGPNDTIFVAAGVYRPIFLWNGGAPYFYNNCHNRISIFGGFAGWEKDLCERNWRINRTIIDGKRKCRCLWIEGEDSKVVIDGFTLTNGIGQGAGARIVNSTPQLSNLKIIRNDATAGGLYGYSSGSGCIYFEHNTQYDNPCNGDYMITTLANVLIANNYASIGAAFTAVASNVRFINTTIACNKSDDCYIQVLNNSNIDIYNSIIWDNVMDCIDYTNAGRKINFYSSDIQDLYNIGNDMGGCFCKDPEFVAPCQDYHVYNTSPIIGAGKPAFYNDLYNQLCYPCYWFQDLDVVDRFSPDGSINMGCYQQTLQRKNIPSLSKQSADKEIDIIEVYNVFGVCLYRCKPNEIEVIKDNLIKGFYILIGRDRNGEVQMRDKLIKK